MTLAAQHPVSSDRGMAPVVAGPARCRLVVVWPILDESMTRSELVAEATPQLPELAAQAHATIIGPVRWRIADAADMVGWTAYQGSVLVAEADAQARRSPNPISRATRLEVVTRLAEAGWCDRQIGEFLGLLPSSVGKYRRAHGIPSGHLSERH